MYLPSRAFPVLTLVFSFLAPLVASDACLDLIASGIDIEFPLTLDYDFDQTQYWSTGCSELLPSCIFSPKSSAEVATILSSLRSNNETFAVKSGGHNPNKYWASIDGAPLISTRLLNEVVLDTESETVRVGPGNRWENVSAALEGTGRTVVGGRIGNVGVGGYILGCTAS